MTDPIPDSELGGKKSPRQELRDKLKPFITGHVRLDDGTRLDPEQAHEALDHLIDEYVVGVIPEKNEVPVKTYQEAKDLIRAGKSGEAIIMVHNATIAEQRRRAGIGEKQ